MSKVNNIKITQELIDRCHKYCYSIIDKKASSVEEENKLYDHPIWRIGNLYHCIDSSKTVKFKPRPAQCVLIYWIFVLGRNRFTILKARQLGFSTCIAIIGLDETVYNKDTTFNIVSNTEDSAKKFLREKINFSLEKLPRGVIHEIPDGNKNASEIVFGDNWAITSKVRHRSGFSSVLWISEWGDVAATDPIRSEEIRTGAIPTASSDNCLVFNESTFKGPAAGDFYDSIMLAKKTTEERCSPKSYWYMFFPWFFEERYRTECQPEWIEQRTHQYFEDLVKKLKEDGNPYTFDKEQMYFWQETGYEQGPKMQREYPSTEEEAMTAPVAGAFYAERMIELERQGKICEFEWDRTKPIYAVCDVASEDPFSIWLVQTDGRSIDIIYSHEEKNKTASHFVNLFHQMGFPIRRWILPWDAQAKNAAFGWVSDFKKAGALDVKMLKKYNGSVSMQIDHMLTVFPRLRFRKTPTIDGRVSVSAYHWEEALPGQLKPKPVHDANSHYGSSFGYIGEAEKMGMFRLNIIVEEDFYRNVKPKKKQWSLPKC